MTLSLFVMISNLLIVCLVPLLIYMQLLTRRYLRDNRRLLREIQEQNAELVRLRQETLAQRAQRFSVPGATEDASATRH